MAHPVETKKKALGMLAEGWSVRDTATSLGVSPASVKTWRDEASISQRPEGHTVPGEGEIAEQLLVKTRQSLEGFELLAPKEKQEVANAVDKLLSKYMTLTGQTTEQRVVISHEEERKLDDLLTQLTRGE